MQNHELSDSANNHGARAHFFALVQRAFSDNCQKIQGLRLTVVLQPFHWFSLAVGFIPLMYVILIVPVLESYGGHHLNISHSSLMVG